jgi:prepilin-type N-terminal cleavage/methylation domain-containing protein
MTRTRKGFSLIEVMVAMTILSIVMMSLAKVGVSIAVRGRTNELAAKRNAALQLETNKVGTIPFANLSSWPTTAKSFTLNGFRYTRRLTITQMSYSRFALKVVIVPGIDSTKKDSVMLDRSRPASGTPLCVSCP